MAARQMAGATVDVPVVASEQPTPRARARAWLSEVEGESCRQVNSASFRQGNDFQPRSTRCPRRDWLCEQAGHISAPTAVRCACKSPPDARNAHCGLVVCAYVHAREPRGACPHSDNNAPPAAARDRPRPPSPRTPRHLKTAPMPRKSLSQAMAGRPSLPRITGPEPQLARRCVVSCRFRTRVDGEAEDQLCEKHGNTAAVARGDEPRGQGQAGLKSTLSLLTTPVPSSTSKPSNLTTSLRPLSPCTLCALHVMHVLGLTVG